MDISEKNKELIISLAVVFAVALIVVGFLYFRQKENGEDGQEQETIQESAQKRELTGEEKKAILESLSAPSASRRTESELTDEEKKEILENLSAPKDSELTTEEKKRILDSLSAPKSQ